MLALLAARPTILKEVAAAPAALRAYVAEQAKDFLADVNADDLLAAHLNNAQDPGATIAAVRAMLKQLSGRYGLLLRAQPDVSESRRVQQDGGELRSAHPTTARAPARRRISPARPRRRHHTAPPPGPA